MLPVHFGDGIARCASDFQHAVVVLDEIVTIADDVVPEIPVPVSVGRMGRGNGFKMMKKSLFSASQAIFLLFFF